MTDAEQTLVDFPAETFRIVVFCDACDRRTLIDRLEVPGGMTVQEIVKALRCSSGGSREASIRIVYTGAGGFEYGGMTLAD